LLCAKFQACGGKAPLWVIRVISSGVEALPLFTQLRTYRCAALSAAKGQHRTQHCNMIGKTPTISHRVLLLISEPLRGGLSEIC
jgi:hypothetical protein